MVPGPKGLRRDAAAVVPYDARMVVPGIRARVESHGHTARRRPSRREPSSFVVASGGTVGKFGRVAIPGADRHRLVRHQRPSGSSVNALGSRGLVPSVAHKAVAAS